MVIEQKEHLSSFMDGESVEPSLFDNDSQHDELQACWHRYHIIKETMQGKMHPHSFTLDITKNVAAIIGGDEEIIYHRDQPTPQDVLSSPSPSLIWVKTKDWLSRVGQVGLAACVTLAIIGGVQYQQNQSNDSDNIATLNTVPVGVSVSPVGGLNQNSDTLQANDKMTQEQYEKIRLLLQDYELQKRLHTQ